MIKKLFWNGEERRLRALLRIVIQTVFVFVLVIPLTLGASALAGYILATLGEIPADRFLELLVSQGAVNHPLSNAIIGIGTLVAITGSVWLGGRFLDRRWFANFGLHVNRDWWIDLGFGLVLGAALMSIIFIVELAAGWVTVTGTFQTPSASLPFGAAVLLQLVLFLCVGFYEELLSRGYHLKNLAEGMQPLGKRMAILLSLLISAAVFGVAHSRNPNASAVSTFNIVIAGIFLGLGMVLTGELAIPIGLHITWNFFQGNVFGFPVSGTGANTTTFIAVAQGGDPAWTGGAFGPEAGILGLGAMVLGGLLVFLWVRWRYESARIQEELAEPDLRIRKGEGSEFTSQDAHSAPTNREGNPES